MKAFFADRRDAGEQLAEALHEAVVDLDIVLGLPRGGVPVAARVADRFGVPLDVAVVRKVGVPWQRELAMGAVGEGGVTVVDHEVVLGAGVSETDFERVVSREREELVERSARYRAVRAAVDLGALRVAVVDDGIATGSTMAAACRVVRAAGARHVIVAAPVASRQAVARLRVVADEVQVVTLPADLSAIGHWYLDFSPTSDEEVVALLAAAAAAAASTADE